MYHINIILVVDYCLKLKITVTSPAKVYLNKLEYCLPKRKKVSVYCVIVCANACYRFRIVYLM